MSTGKTWSTSSDSSRQTEALGEQVGKKLKGGEVIELVSDLGGGKTTFVRGLARGVGSEAHVSSPTFKISNVYHGPKFDIQHFDFYRLNEAGIVADELAEFLGDSQTVVLVEWGDIVHDVLSEERLVITFKTTAEDTRELTFNYPSTLEYLIEELAK